MLRRFVPAILFISAAFGARDWNLYPAVVQIDTAADVYAVGDVHADPQRLSALLAGAGLIDPHDAHWTAGPAVLVCTGDLIDKGPDAPGVFALLRALDSSARAAGGRIVILMGNHEAEALAAPNGSIGFLSELPIAARVNGWFFSHAGNTSGRTLTALDADLRHAIDTVGFATPELLGPKSILEARLGGDKAAGGVPWFQAAAPRGKSEELLQTYATAVGAHHLVEGHQHGNVRFPDGARRAAGEMYQWRGKLFLIDVGMSREIDDSAGALLHILPGGQEAAAICPDGRAVSIWSARRPGQSGHIKPCRPKKPRATGTAASARATGS
jgi:hypothetical protein